MTLDFASQGKMMSSRPQVQLVSSQNSPVRPVIGACNYTHIPPSLLWPCGWLAFTATLKPCALCFCYVWLCASSHLQTGPPTAEASLLATKWRTSLNKHPVASTLPLLFIMGCRGSLQRMAFSMEVQKHLDVWLDSKECLLILILTRQTEQRYVSV